MKCEKLWAALLALTLTFTLSACGEKAPPSATETPEVSDAASPEVSDTAAPDVPDAASPEVSDDTGSEDTPLDSWMKDVLDGNKTFTRADSGKTFSISELDAFYYADYPDGNNASEFPVMDMETVKLALVDLDGDGANEMVIWPQSEDEYLYSAVGYAILHQEGDVVYGYNLGYRAFGLLKADGTYHWSSSAAESGTGTMSFEGNQIEQRNIIWSEPTESDALRYFVNGQEATQEEFETANEEQEQKPEPVWYTYSDGVLQISE